MELQIFEFSSLQQNHLKSINERKRQNCAHEVM